MKSILAGLFLLFTLGASSVEAVSADLPIRVGFQPGTAPRFFVARDQQMFQKAGLAPEFLKFISGPTMLAALQNEDIDVAFMTTAPVIFGLSQDLDIKVFFIESDAAETQALVATQQGSIKTLDDQKGKRIAVTFGTSTHYALLKSLQAVKLSTADLTILDMQPTAMLPAFIKGDIAGAWSWDPWTAKMESEGGTLIGSLATLRLPMPGVWVVRTKWLNANSEAIQRFIKAMDTATSYMKTHENEAAAAIATELSVENQVALRILRRIEVPPLPEQIQGYSAALGSSENKTKSGMATHMNDMASFFFELKRIPMKPDVTAAIDPRPLEIYLAGKR